MKSMLLLLFLATGVAAAPSATVALTFTDGSSLDADVTVQYDGADASYLRGQMDADQDGNVTASEADAYGERARRLADDAGIGPPVGRLVMGRDWNSTVRVTSVAVHGAEGGNNSTQRLGVSWRMHISFEHGAMPGLFAIEPGNKSRSGFISAPVQSLVIVAPPGHFFNTTGGLPLGATLSGDSRMVTMPALPANDMQFQIAPEQRSEDAPGPSVLLVLALLLASVSVCRRKVFQQDPLRGV